MRTLVIASLMVVSLGSLSQQSYYLNESRQFSTAVPYLLDAPDARSVGTGGSGVASSPDVFSAFWNPAKYAFVENSFGIAASYTGYLWMKEIWHYKYRYDLSLGFTALHAYYKINAKSALAYSFTYFKQFHDITITDLYGNNLGNYEPIDINTGLSYSYKISSTFSAAMACRYIFSRLTTTQFIQGAEVFNANSVAFDLSVYYQLPLDLGSKEGEFRWGIDISNMGMKLSYYKDQDNKSFIPTNFRIGAGFTYEFDDENSLAVQVDANKLLVPTPPIYMVDENGHHVYDENGDYVIGDGMDPNVSACKGMIQSWYDAPGGFREEMQEWAVAGGLEYSNKNRLSLRSGVFYENEKKGTRQFFTTGAGYKFGPFSIDLALKVPLNRSFKEDYFSIFYLRTSLALDISSLNHRH